MLKPIPRLAALLLGCCLLTQTPSPVFAETPTYPELKTASGFSRFIQGASGFTLISGLIANRVLHRELAKHVKGNLHSRLSLFSGTDLLGGKARGIEISGKNVLVENFLPLSKFRFENDGAMPLFVSKDSHPILLRPVRFKISGVMSEADINAMLQSEKARGLLTDMQISMPPFGKQSFDALEPKVTVEGDQLVIQSLMNLHNAPRENALPVVVRGKISAENSRLNLSDLDLQVADIPNTEEIAQVIEDYFGELVNLDKLKIDRHRVKIEIQQSALQDHQLRLSALMTVEPDSKALKKVLAKHGQRTR